MHRAPVQTLDGQCLHWQEPQLRAQPPGPWLTLWLQPGEVPQNGSERWPLCWFVGQALAGECGQLRA